jgi:nucleotide-binding universal stress UspA family protein
MFKTILVAVDGSATSNLGLEEAILLAAEQKAALCVLHVVDEHVFSQGLDMPLYIEGLWEALREAGRNVLAQAVSKAEQSGATARPILAETTGRRVSDVILDEAQKCRADLIVLGTHGRRGMSRLVMGSDAEGVVRQAMVPVLLVRTRRGAQQAPTDVAERKGG